MFTTPATLTSLIFNYTYFLHILYIILFNIAKIIEIDITFDHVSFNDSSKYTIQSNQQLLFLYIPIYYSYTSYLHSLTPQNTSNTSISYFTNPYNSSSLIHPVLLLSLIIQQVTNNTNHHYSYSIPFYIISYHHTILTILKANYTNKSTISLSYFNYLIQYHIIITYTSSILNTSFSFFISGHPTQLS